MTTLRRFAPGLVLAATLLLPGTVLADGPSPTPVIKQQAPPTVAAARATVAPPGATAAPPRTPAAPAAAPPSPTPAPAAPTPVPPTPTVEPTQVPPTATVEPTPAPTTQPTPAPTTQPTPAPTTQPTPVATQTPEPSPNVAPIADDAFTIWHGIVREGGAYRRSAPSSAAEILEDLDPGTPIRVDRWVAGSMLYPDVITWGQVDPEDGGGYIFGGSLEGILPPAVPPAPDEMQDSDATWIDVNLTLNVVTVYEGGLPVKMILTSPGRPGHETDTGRFSVRSKLPSQTMTGPGYSVPAVPSVEYFFGAEALHGRYWTLPNVLPQSSADIDDDGQFQADDDSQVMAGGVNSGVAFGVPSSHGCLGMEVGAAAWLYTQTGYGTPVDVHY
jgi:hypothetical protein